MEYCAPFSVSACASPGCRDRCLTISPKGVPLESGEHRWRWRHENGQGFGFIGVMLEVAVHSKIVHTQLCDPGDTEFGSMGGEPSIITVTLNETNGITNVATLIKYASKADRDAGMSTGMTDGMEMSYQSLDGVLAG